MERLGDRVNHEVCPTDRDRPKAVGDDCVAGEFGGGYHMLGDHVMALHARIRWYGDRLKQVAKEDARVRLLWSIPSVDAVTPSAIIANVGDGHRFSNDREFAVLLGLMPANKSSGGKEKLGRVTKKGRSILTITFGRRHDLTCPTDQVVSGTSK